MPVGGPHRENWPALQAVRAASSVGGTCGDGVIPTVGVSPPRPCGPLCRPEVGVPLPAGPSLPVGSAPRREPSRGLGYAPPRPCGPLCRPEVGVPSRPGFFATGDGSFAALRAAVPGSTGRTARRSGFQPSSRLFSVCGARHSRWQDGASSGRVSRSRAMPVGDRRSSRPRACSPSAVRGTHAGTVIGTGFALPAMPVGDRRSSVIGRDGASSVSRSRAMPVGDRRSWRFPACSAKRRPADLAAGLLGGTFAESRTPVGERTALPADRRRWKSPAAESRSRWSRWSRCSCRSSRG